MTLPAPETALEARRRGPRFLAALYAAVRNASVFEIDSATARDSFGKLFDELQEMWRQDSEAVVQTSGSFLILNGERLRVDLVGANVQRYLLSQMRSHQIGLIEFQLGLSVEEMGRFVFLLARCRHEGNDALDAIRVDMDAQGIHYVDIQAPVSPFGDVSQKGRAVGAYFRSVEVTQDAFDRVRRGQPVNLCSVKRVVQDMVETAAHNPFYLSCMASNLREYAGYECAHSANVSALSVCFGAQLAAPRSVLGDLGLAALVKEMGKLGIQQEILKANRPLTEEERREISRYPLHGIKALLRSPELTDSAICAIAVCFEQHLRESGGEMAAQVYGLPATLAGIIRIVDAYDALRTPRPFRPTPFTPAEVFQILLKDAGRKYDPVLLRRFMEFQGVFPTGTLVELNTGERAVVCAQAGTLEDLDRPVVRTIPTHRDEEPCYVDLAAPNERELTRITRMRTRPPSMEEMQEYVEML